MKKEFDHIIVGQGIAGSLLAYRLISQNRRVLVIDPFEPLTASRIAAGMFTPLSGKRMLKSWMVDRFYPVMQQTYTELEQLLKVRFLFNKNVQLSFGNMKEQNDFYSALNDEIGQYVIPEITPHPYLKAPFGAAEILRSGWINTSLFLEHFRQWLSAGDMYLHERLDYTLLSHHHNKWHYKDNEAGSIIFCEGSASKHNPFFKDVPVIDNKGDVFIIETGLLDDQKIYKRGVYAVNLNGTTFKVGSTYKWSFDQTGPTQEGYEELRQKTDLLINGEYHIAQHLTGIRPTTRDRRPILGKHETEPGMYFFNGLGTKGILQVPYFSQVMADLVLGDEIPDHEVNLTRFKSKPVSKKQA